MAMSDIWMEYTIFLLKALTIFGGIGFIITQVVRAKKNSSNLSAVSITKLNAEYDKTQAYLQQVACSRKDRKKREKELKKSKKQCQKNTKKSAKPRVFILSFKGDLRASAAEALRDEITAILLIAQAKDEVVVKLESPGGCVHDYGFAASQLARIREQEIMLTIAVDKMAASGGYLMASVANKIIAAPFAVIGSIGVILQTPNFHKLLKENNIQFEQLTAGDEKRTLTVFGHNTNEARKKAQAQIDQIHTLFIEFIQRYRPHIEPKQVATGKAWHASEAIDLQLIDALTTSDDYLFSLRHSHDLYTINKPSIKKSKLKQITSNISAWLLYNPV